MLWRVYTLMASILAALTANFAKVGVKDVNSHRATAVGTVVILIIFLAVALVNGGSEGLMPLSEQSLVFLVISGVTNVFSWFLYFKLLRQGKVNDVTPFDKLGNILMPLFSAMFLGVSLCPKINLATPFLIIGA